MTIKIQNFVLGCVVFILFIYSYFFRSECGASMNELPSSIHHQKYQGYQFWNKNQTLGVKTLVETKFARAQLHTVKLENGEVINDWLWFDEGDAINCIVQTKPVRGEEAKFLVFEQRKYGFEGVSFAPVGGFVEPNESPIQAAKREVFEETGYLSNDFVNLGSYRVAANRGAGMIHLFLARNGVQQQDKVHNTADFESQKVVMLTKTQLRNAVAAGKFKEVKWTAAIALALLLLDDGDA